MSNIYFSCILSRDVNNGGIGFRNFLPWSLPEDMKFFKSKTQFNTNGKENIVIMGKNTWKSIKNTPLVRRINIVVSKSLKSNEISLVETGALKSNEISLVETGALKSESLKNMENNNLVNVKFSSSFDEALQLASSFGKGRNIFVIGGKALYKEAFLHHQLETIYETLVNPFVLDPHPSIRLARYDTYFNDSPPENFYEVRREVKNSNGSILTFIQYNKKRETDENKYISLIKYILKNGEERFDRTKIGTLSVFGKQITFNISEKFPLLTTKFVPIKMVFEELMWMLRGQTNNNTLKRAGVQFWTKNSNDYHKKLSEHGDKHSEGDMGQIYGYNWRSFGGEYKPINPPDNIDERIKEEMEDKRYIEADGGFDQIKYILNQIKTDPTSRRIIFSAWNPKSLDKVCLPPCHFACQFYIRKNKFLDCKLSMRSNDIFLGAPFNIAQYSLLTYMIASMTGYIPGELIYSIGDSHIYSNHVEQVQLQILRTPRDFPTLEITSIPEKIEDFKFEYLKFGVYNHHPMIKGDMAV